MIFWIVLGVLMVGTLIVGWRESRIDPLDPESPKNHKKSYSHVPEGYSEEEKEKAAKHPKGIFVDWKDFIVGVLLFWVIEIIACLFVFGLLGMALNNKVDEKIINKQKVVTLQDSQNASGDVGGFLFVSGYVESNLTFSWYYEENGAYLPETVTDKGDTHIRVHEIDDDSDAFATESENVYDTPDTVFPWNIAAGAQREDRYWDLYVPRGTVSTGQFKLDAK